MKETKKIILITILSGLAVGLVLTSQALAYTSDSSGGSSSVLGRYKEIILDCQYPEAPSEMPRLRVINKEWTQAEVESLAEDIFGFTGEFTDLRENYPDWWDMELRNRPDHNMYVGAGGWEYFKEGTMSFRQRILPSYGEAREIADNFMERLVAYGLTPINLTITSGTVGIGAQGVQPAVNGTPEQHIIFFLNADFDAYYEEYEVLASTVISIGENGEIVEVVYHWRDVEEDGTTKITVTPEQALNQLGKTNAAIMGVMDVAHVKEIEMAYYCKPVTQEQDYLEPVYIFTLEGDGQTWTEPVSATGRPTAEWL